MRRIKNDSTAVSDKPDPWVIAHADFIATCKRLSRDDFFLVELTAAATEYKDIKLRAEKALLRREGNIYYVDFASVMQW